MTDLASGSVIAYASDGTPRPLLPVSLAPKGSSLRRPPMAAYFYADAETAGGVLSLPAGNRTLFHRAHNPIGLAVDSGDILVAENGADRIRSIPIDGSPAIISGSSVTVGMDAHAFDQVDFSASLSRPEIRFRGSR